MPNRLRGPTFGAMTYAQHRDVPCRCGIGRPSVAATNTLEAIPRRPVTFIDAATFRTSPGRVARIDADQRDAFPCGLISQKGSQLSKRPTGMCSALRLANRGPFADACQVFDGNSAPGVFSLPNDRLTNPVVQVAGEPRLFGPAFPEKPLGRFCSLLLEFTAQPRMTLAKIGVVGTAESLSIAISSNVLQTKIDAEVFNRVAFRHIPHVDSHVQEEHTITIDQIGLSARPIQLSTLIGATDHGMICLPSLVRMETRSAPFHDRMRWS